MEEDTITHLDQPLLNHQLEVSDDAGRLPVTERRIGVMVEIAWSHRSRRRMEMTVEGRPALSVRHPMVDHSRLVPLRDFGSARRLMVDAMTDDRATEKHGPTEPDLLQQLATGNTFGQGSAQTMPPTTMPKPRNNA